jgi:hypothetical protein
MHDPRMSREEVIQVARKDATAHGYDLALYGQPEAEFETTDREYTWVIAFRGKVPGRFLSVVIDEHTGERGFVDESGWHPYRP